MRRLRLAGLLPVCRGVRATAAIRSAAAGALARIGTADAVAALVKASQQGSRGTRAASRTQLDAIANGRTAGGRTS